MVDTALRRLFYVRMKHGEFDPPSMVPYRDEKRYGIAAFDYDKWNNVSLDAARQSLTLLKNDGGFLPLSRPGTKEVPIAVIGVESAVFAGYSTGGMKNFGLPSEMLRAFGYTVIVEKGCIDGPSCARYDGVAVRRAAKLASGGAAVVFVGRGILQGEKHDLSNLTLPGSQALMVRDAMESGTPVILVLLTANPFDITFAVNDSRTRAIISAYYPQNWGGRAIAEALVGAFAPAGRMSFSWPRDLSQAGAIGNYTMSGTNKTYRYGLQDAVFPFGFGLSYSSWKYSQLQLSSVPSSSQSAFGMAVAPCSTVTVSVRLSNTGPVDSDEVVQVYAHWNMNASSIPRLSAPLLQLVGFERVHVQAGSSQLIRINIGPQEMAVLNTSGSYTPQNPSARIRPCAGNSTDGKCGSIASADFMAKKPIKGLRGMATTDECCAACSATPQTGDGSCVAWTLVGQDCRSDPERCVCWLHSGIEGFRSQGSMTSGVVFARVPKHSIDDACADNSLLPVWTVVPLEVQLSVGGQQPKQKTRAPSNVLTAGFLIQGPATPVVKCIA